MKKIILITAMLMMTATLSMGQLLIKQIAFGAKSVDSLVGTANGTAAGTKYYYLNTTGTVASGLVVATQPWTQYEILAIQVGMVAPTKAADMMDSTQIWIETSLDGTNWTKYANAGATTPATQYQYKHGGPKFFGTGTTYVYVPDLVTQANAAGGATYWFNGLIAPYVRVATKSYDDATGAFYPKIYFTAKKLN